MACRTITLAKPTVSRRQTVRVLHVIDSLGLGGGAEHSLAAMLPLLRERGIDSSLAVIHPRVGGLQQRLGEEGYPVTVLDGPSWPGRIRSLRELIGNEQPDLVHSTLYYSCITSRLAMVGLDTPLLNSLVNTSYGPTRLIGKATSRWKLWTVRTIDRVTARRLVDGFHAVTAEVRDEAVDVLGVQPDRITIIPEVVRPMRSANTPPNDATPPGLDSDWGPIPRPSSTLAARITRRTM